MLATFIIGLREGLEAALIVGIIAAFLTKNGRRLTPMWIGVGSAVLLSLAVGITLAVVEHSLPQSAQEGMETVIGAVAVFFVTGMILWMSSHSRGLKRELEASAQHALGGGASSALVVMAFLAVLKEGFETSVFLLATFQASTSAAVAATGALLGILVSIGLGIAIYRGGVRINLSKFFRATGIFLVLVAAGLVVTALRTAHEAGWLNAGQQRTFDLSWLAPVGSIRGALFTGVLGILTGGLIISGMLWRDNPLGTTFVVGAGFTWMLGITGIVYGTLKLIAAIGGAGWWSGVLGGLVAVLSIMLFMNPLAAVVALPWSLGVVLIAGGILLVVVALRMR